MVFKIFLKTDYIIKKTTAYIDQAIHPAYKTRYNSTLFSPASFNEILTLSPPHEDNVRIIINMNDNFFISEYYIL